jgi:nicotinamide-nucleotide amidase
MSLFPQHLVAEAANLIDLLRAGKLMLATAESCTGGLAAGLLTTIPGASDVFERGFVSYSNAAKSVQLGVPAATITAHGAVSEETARAMSEGTLINSAADIAVSVTGVAGPGGGTPSKPVGLVHVACARTHHATLHTRLDLGEREREEIRLLSIAAMLRLVRAQTMAP